MAHLLPGEAPHRVTLEGRYCRIEPLGAVHVLPLFEAVSGPDAEARHRYLAESAPTSAHDLAAWVDQVSSRSDPLFFAVIDGQSGLCRGRQAFMRIRPEHRSIEIGSVLWGRGIARTRIATEALYLFANYVFETLQYRRFEWKCNAFNLASRSAAMRFGFKFEGIFRQDMIVKGDSRDTAWFSMLDSEWADLEPVYRKWLTPANFDPDGRALTRLGTPRP